VAVKDDPRFDLIVLDTPPTANALDFLDAPERLIEALDSAATRWFLEAFQSTGGFSLNIIAKGAAAVLRGLGKITGGEFLSVMAEFIAELNDLFGGFRERARMVESALRSDDVAFVLVTSPAPPAIKEVLYFAERLAETNIKRAALVVNRVHHAPSAASPADAVRAAEELATAGLDLGTSGPSRVEQAYRDARALAELDRRNLDGLTREIGALTALRVPAFDTDVHDIARLARIADVLLGAPASPGDASSPTL
jgi:anion-transporting  ArsA/GET3 family ATPase